MALDPACSVPPGVVMALAVIREKMVRVGVEDAKETRVKSKAVGL